MVMDVEDLVNNDGTKSIIQIMSPFEAEVVIWRWSNLGSRPELIDL